MIGKVPRIITSPPIATAAPPSANRLAGRLARWFFYLGWTGAVMLGSAVLSSATAATILVLGDSLSAAYQMEIGQGWVHLLERRLNADGENRYRVVNLSVTGETTRGVRARLPAALQEHAPDLVILELGGNDGLRGFPLQQIEDNLDAMIVESKAAGSDVLLLGMRLPPNYGFRYTRAFADLYQTLASRHQLAWVPFFLEGVAGDAGFMRSDGVHPTVSAQPLLLDNVWPALGVWMQSEAERQRKAGFY